MSIYNAIANVGSNAGAGLNAFAQNRYRVQQDQADREFAADQVKTRNKFVERDFVEQAKQRTLQQAVQIAAGGGSDDDILGLLAGASQEYGLPAPDPQVLPRIRAMAQSTGRGAKHGLNPVYFRDAQGNMVLGQMLDSGGVSIVNPGEGMTPVPANLMAINQGPQVTMVDPRTGTPVAQYGVGLKPGEEPGVRAEQTLAVEGARSEAERLRNFGRVSKLLEKEEREHDFMLRTLDQAIELAGKGAGYGSMLSVLPASDARRLSTLLTTIKARVGFGQLSEMRAASPTGGALGAVSNIENELLQATQGSLDQKLSAEDLRANLQQIKEMREGAMNELRNAYFSDYADMAERKGPRNRANDGVLSGRIDRSGKSIDDLVNKYAPE